MDKTPLDRLLRIAWRRVGVKDQLTQPAQPLASEPARLCPTVPDYERSTDR
jgi:hypothetical protein